MNFLKNIKICLWVLCISKNSVLKKTNNAQGLTNTRGQPTGRATSNRLCPPRGAAVSGQLFLPAWPKRLSLLGRLGWLAQPRSPTQAAATGIQWSDFWAKSWSGRCSCGLRGKEGWQAGFATALYFFEAPRMVYSVPGAVGPRTAAASVALSPGNNGGSHLRSSRWYGSSLRGSLRFQEHATSSRTNSPIWITRRAKEVPLDFSSNSFFFILIRTKHQNAWLMGDSALFDQLDANQIKRKKDWRSIIKQSYR